MPRFTPTRWARAFIAIQDADGRIQAYAVDIPPNGRGEMTIDSERYQRYDNIFADPEAYYAPTPLDVTLKLEGVRQVDYKPNWQPPQRWQEPVDDQPAIEEGPKELTA